MLLHNSFAFNSDWAYSSTPHKSLAINLYIRGKQAFNSHDISCLNSSMSKLMSLGINTYRDSTPLFGHEKSLGALANCSHIEEPLEWVLRWGTVMYRNGAYLHHYSKEVFSKEDFENSFISAETCLSEYQKL